MIDAVLSPHVNPFTCGTAKWSVRLAQHLGVPCVGLDRPVKQFKHPLLSCRLTELSDECWLPSRYDLFVHDWDARWTWLLVRARRLFAANDELAGQMADATHRDIHTAWCPPTIDGNPHRGGYRVLTFGMAHKVQRHEFCCLKAQLEREHPDYTISLSTAVHEGCPWDEALTGAATVMREIFGDRLRVLGFLGDDALAKELLDCHAVAAFFDPAFRANNTSAWAALAAGKRLYTNTDARSPDPDPVAYGWPPLVELLCANS